MDYLLFCAVCWKLEQLAGKSRKSKTRSFLSSFLRNASFAEKTKLGQLEKDSGGLARNPVFWAAEVNKTSTLRIC